MRAVILAQKKNSGPMKHPQWCFLFNDRCQVPLMGA